MASLLVSVRKPEVLSDREEREGSRCEVNSPIRDEQNPLGEEWDGNGGRHFATTAGAERPDAVLGVKQFFTGNQ